MKQNKDRPSLTKVFSYIFLSAQRDPRDRIFSYPFPCGRTLSPEELEEQKRQRRHFLLLQTLRP